MTALRSRIDDCYLCGCSLIGLLRYQCTECRDIRYCSRCSINAASDHPIHPLKASQPPAAATQQSEVGSNDMRQGVDRPRPSFGRDSAVSQGETSSPLCCVCSASRAHYQCQEYSSMLFRDSCGKLHSFHAVERIPQAGPVSNSISPGHLVHGDNVADATIRSDS
jgi:hypothetical protein